jgi:hypothetical protein
LSTQAVSEREFPRWGERDLAAISELGDRTGVGTGRLHPINDALREDYTLCMGKAHRDSGHQGLSL